MDYQFFSVEDFAGDEYFQSWVRTNNALADTFWSDWIAEHPEKKETVEEARRLVLLIGFDEEKFTEDDLETMWKNIVTNRGQKSEKPFASRFSKFDSKILLRVAAIFIGVISTMGALHYSGVLDGGQKSLPVEGTSIVLELHDGSLEVIDETVSKDIVDRSGNTIVSQEKNVLSYGQGDSDKTEELVYNKLTVPYGKKFELKLSDGSHVVLNSGSKLRYPVNFIEGAPRDIYLDGEAYFKVTKDASRPFTVITDEMNTRVYGTEFNVSSYKNDDNTATVLVEGSVGVYKSNNGEALSPVIITPGHRAVFKNNEIEVAEANIAKYTSWTENKLLFLNEPFELILKKLERNFAIDIENEFSELNDKQFTGTFENNSPEDILNIFREYSPFEYTRNGNQFIITKSKVIENIDL